jgi:hypothetical protein
MPFPYGDIAGLTAWRAGAQQAAPLIKSIVEGGFDFGFGDGAFADYVPVVAV